MMDFWSRQLLRARCSTASTLTPGSEKIPDTTSGRETEGLLLVGAKKNTYITSNTIDVDAGMKGLTGLSLVWPDAASPWARHEKRQ